MMRKTGLSLDLARKTQNNKAIQSNSTITNFVLILTVLICLSAILLVNPFWISAWGAMKFIGLGLSVCILVAISLILWMFGGVGRKIGFTLIDLVWFVAVIGVLVVALMSGDQQVLWGSATRPYDGAIMIAILGVLYAVLRFVVSRKGVALLAGMSGFMAVLASGSFSITYLFSDALSQLSPTFSPISGASHQLGAVAILGSLLVRYAYENSDQLAKNIFIWLWWISVGVTFVVLESVGVTSFFILWAATLALVWGQHILGESNKNQLFSNESNRSPISTFIWGLPIAFAILTIWFVSLPTLPSEILPGPRLGLDISRQVLTESPFIGAGTVQYGWSEFFPVELLATPQWDLTFDTLGQEVLNMAVRFGVFPMIALILLIALIMSFAVREIVQSKTLPLEYVLGGVAIVLAVLVPFELVMKLFATLTLVLVVQRIERVKSWLRFSVGSFHVNRLSPQWVSVGSVVSLVGIILVGLLAFQLIQIGRGYQAMAVAIRASDQPAFIDSSTRAIARAPMYMDFGEIFISERISNLENRLRELTAEDQEALEDVQSQIQNLDRIIAEYEQDLPKDLRVYRARIDLLMITHEFSEQAVPQVLAVIDQAQTLRPNSPVWDRYRAEYYAIAYRRSQTQEDLDLAIESIERSLATRPIYVEGRILYADILGLQSDGQAEQIQSLEDYLRITQERGIISDRRVVYRLAQEYQESERFTEAQNLLEQLTQAFPEFTNAWYTLGQVYSSLGDTVQAREALQKAQELDPESPEIQQELNQLGL